MTVRIRKERHARNFVAAQVGFWDSQPVQKIERFLRVENEKAGAYVLKIQQFVLLEGNFDGSFQATADDLAWHLKFKGKPDRLLDALLRAEVITPRKRARRPDVWEFVGWRDSPTGRYQAIKEYDRARAHRQRVARKEQELARLAALAAEQQEALGLQNKGETNGQRARGGSQKVLGLSADDSVISDKQSKEKKRKEIRSPQPPTGGPAAPPAPGDTDAQWAWFQDVYPKPDWPKKCRAAWNALTDEDRELIRLHVPKVILRRAEKFQPGMLSYLLSHAWLEMRRKAKPMKPAEPPQQRQKKVATNGSAHDDHASNGSGFTTMARAAELKAKYRAEGLRGDELQAAVDAAMAAEITTQAKAN